MSFLKNLRNTMTVGATLDEGTTAIAAASTAVTGIIVDPVYAGLTGIATACLFKECRTPAYFAGVGGTALLQLALGPGFGTLATAAMLVANRALQSQKAELDAKVEDVMHRASAYAAR